jgi:hypothetical protein
MSADWYYLVMGETYGPINGKALRSLAKAGDIQPDTFVRRNGNDWVMADRVHGLFKRPRIPVRKAVAPFNLPKPLPRRDRNARKPVFRLAQCPHCGEPMRTEPNRL